MASTATSSARTEVEAGTGLQEHFKTVMGKAAARQRIDVNGNRQPLEAVGTQDAPGRDVSTTPFADQDLQARAQAAMQASVARSQATGGNAVETHIQRALAAAKRRAAGTEPGVVAVEAASGGISVDEQQEWQAAMAAQSEAEMLLPVTGALEGGTPWAPWGSEAGGSGPWAGGAAARPGPSEASGAGPEDGDAWACDPWGMSAPVDSTWVGAPSVESQRADGDTEGGDVWNCTSWSSAAPWAARGTRCLGIMQ